MQRLTPPRRVHTIRPDSPGNPIASNGHAIRTLRSSPVNRRPNLALAPARPAFALIAALWLLVAISVAGLELSLRARERRLAAANVLEGARARVAAEAGLEHARAYLERLVEEADPVRAGVPPELRLDPWARAVGVFPDSVVLGDARYRVDLRDAGAALNLNRAGEEELRRFFRALRVDYGEADRIAQAVMDWRDADDAHRARGAEREAYLREGRPVLPRNGPFAALSELMHVRGVTPEIYERARPHLTLLGTGRVNLNAADRPVLRALPGMGEEAVAAALRARRSGRRIASVQDLSLELSRRGREELAAAAAALAARASFETEEVEVRVEGWADGARVRARAEALAVRTGGSVHVVSRRVE